MKILKTILIFTFLFSLQLNNYVDSIAGVFAKKMGGTITFYNYCADPIPGINIVVIDPVPPSNGSGSFMWIPGATFPFLYGPPAYPGQDILGLASWAYTPCMDGPVVVGPGGLIALYSGTGQKVVLK